jgi:hypothetical protein
MPFARVLDGERSQHLGVREPEASLACMTGTQFRYISDAPDLGVCDGSAAPGSGLTAAR